MMRLGESFIIWKLTLGGVDYTLVYDLENKEYPYLFVETKFYFKQKAKVKEPDQRFIKENRWVIYIWNNLYTGSHHYNNYN